MIFHPFVAFSAQIKGRELYMTCIPDSSAGYLEFNPSAKVPSLIARFVVESVPNSNDLVHIRSCYKNQYLCRRTPFTYWGITAARSKPVNDVTADDCTLFRVKDLGSRMVTLTHVRGGHPISSFPDYAPCQRVVTGAIKPLCLKVVDYGMLVTLPKRVIFKGDNGQYLRCLLKRPWPLILPGSAALRGRAREYNEFASDDGSNRSSHYEITHYNGTIRVKSLEFGKFLRRNADKNYSSWILGDSNADNVDTMFFFDENVDTLFAVENLGNNVIALRNLGNNKVCRRLTDEDEDRLDNCLKAAETYVVNEARLTVEEPVSYRRITAQYKLDDARITSQTLEYHSTVQKENKYSSGDGKVELTVMYKKTRKTEWSKTTSHTNTASAKIDIELPKFVKGQISLDGKIEDVKHFEEGSYSSIDDSARSVEKVPPMTKVVLTGYVLKATYDVPCSYIESIVYNTGEKETIVVEDGVCQGLESHGCHFKTEHIKLS